MTDQNDGISACHYIFLCGIQTIFVIAMNLYYFTCCGIWRCIISPLLFLNPSLFWLIDGYLQKLGFLLIANWGWTAGFRCKICSNPTAETRFY